MISTAFVESTVNQVISKRMVKKQQMQWTPRGAHLLLQIRTKVINDELEEYFADGIRGSAQRRDPRLFGALQFMQALADCSLTKLAAQERLFLHHGDGQGREDINPFWLFSQGPHPFG